MNRRLTIAALLTPALYGAALPVAADATLAQSTPAVNLGAAANLTVGPGNSALLRFELGALPAAVNAGTVNVAYLRVYLSRVTAGGDVALQPVTGAWTEPAVTFNTAPATGRALATFTASTGNTFVVIDVTAQVRAWLSVPASNFGFALTQAPGSAVTATFDSKENQLTSHAAELEISFTPPVGPTGPAGPQGPAGAPGGAGVAGPVGPAGATGPIGPAGPGGAKGLTGDAGPQGPTGPAGTVAGPVGPPGPAGTPGPTGPIGDTGAAGAPGAAGPTGAAGPQGAAGAAGVLGPKGPAGPTGPAGAMGPAGPTGAAGAAGPQGPAGVAGDAGPAGAVGPQGAAGPAGSTGPTGPAGEDGPYFNSFPMDPTVRSSGYTIPDGDAFVYYIVANPTTAIVTVTLPHANRAGRTIHLLIQDYAFANTNKVSQALQVNAQGTDRILTSAAGSSLTSHRAGKALRLVSDGGGKWYVTGQL